MSRVLHAQNPSTPYSDDLEMLALGFCGTPTTVAWTEYPWRPEGSVSPNIDCKRCIAKLARNEKLKVELCSDTDHNLRPGTVRVIVFGRGVGKRIDPAVLDIIRTALADAGHTII
jgi:hypothetical protein